jgi:ParB family chromosome partitioning protein
MAKMGILKNVQSRTGTQDSRSVTLTVKDIPIGDIHIKMNVREDYTEISELMESIRQYGLLQPITVYAVKDGYAVKFGHRRLLAYKKLYQEDPEKYHSIRCIISDNQNIALIQLIENVQRVDLSQHDLYQALNQLREQGMSLRQIGEVIGKSEGYIKSLFVGVNEINRDKDLQTLIGSDAGITIRDIAETKPIKDKNQRLALLEERKSGKINREQMREKVSELSAATPKKEMPQKTLNGKARPVKIHIAIKAFPEMSKIIIYLTNGGRAEQLKTLESELRSYFSANKEKYRIEKASPEKEVKNG